MDKPRLEVQYKNEPQFLTPEEISAMVLARMKETADMSFGIKVKDSVIMVPAYSHNTGDTHLRGEDFDNRMADHLVNVPRQKHKMDQSMSNNIVLVGGSIRIP